MLALAFLEWWYGAGWVKGYRDWIGRLKRTYYGFSVPLLLRTLVAPWRRIVTPKAGAIGDKLRAVVDNAVSRTVGLVVRLITLVAAAVVCLWWSLICLIQLVAWPLLPVAALGLVIWAAV